jgi:hypothetical protein
MKQLVAGLGDVCAVAGAELFFVVGSPRSGTTWVQRALNAHPEISCSGEGHFFAELAPRLEKALDGYSRNIRRRSKLSLGDEKAFTPLDESDDLLCLAVLLILSRNARPGSRWIGEKTPDNILVLERLSRMFPAARFIHVCRDPRDVCVSAWFNNLRFNRAGTLEKWPSFDRYAPVHARAWSNRLIAARHFAASHPQNYHEVQYETLIADFGAAFSSLLEFLGAPATIEIVARCREAGSFEEAAGRAVGVEDPGSHFRRGEAGTWQAYFNAALARRYADIAGREMQLLGYDPAAN